ncbi:MAG: topoisomerase DNA-binding C4 zinc finger domain-containing protein, partial [Alphaproteobacteria bacterium]|nr:topoisomerase DNA-binding C4 zinc finger domain-containing protein [Alphaproteobacteria bacterium]
CKKGRLGIKLGRFGAFIGCSNYPECGYTKQLIDTTAEEEAFANAPKLATPEDKVLGEHEGETIYLKKGPYGYYVQLGDDKGKEKPKRCSLPREVTPETISLEQAVILLNLPRQLGNGIEVNIGKFGPYLKQNGKSKSLTGGDSIFNITLERAEQILSNVAEKPQAKVIGTNPENKQEITFNQGRYGPYLKCGKTNFALPKDMKGREPTLEEAIQIVNKKK